MQAMNKYFLICGLLFAGLLGACSSSPSHPDWHPNVDLGSDFPAVRVDLEEGCPVVLTDNGTLVHEDEKPFRFELTQSGFGNVQGSIGMQWATASGLGQVAMEPQESRVIDVFFGGLSVRTLVEFTSKNSSFSIATSAGGSENWHHANGFIVVEEARWPIRLKQLLRP
jgi:hypothetical protein